jgi:hypothetical protein
MGMCGMFPVGRQSKEQDMIDGHDQDPFRGFARRARLVSECHQHE